MSETPSSKPRHALSDTGPAVPAQSGPRDDLFGTGSEGAAPPSVPEQQAPSPAAGPAPDRADGAPPAIPQPSPSGDDLFGTVEPPRETATFEEAPTQALPVIPRPRDDRAGRGDPAAAALARLPEPFRPAPVPGAVAPASSGSGGHRLPELPWVARPALGAATALVLAFGVVAGVTGAPDPAAAPAPPAPVSNP